MYILCLIPSSEVFVKNSKTFADITFQVYGLYIFVQIFFCLVHSWILMMSNQTALSLIFSLARKVHFEMYRPKFCSERVSDKMAFYTIQFSNVFPHLQDDSLYWKMSASQNWIWPHDPSLVETVETTLQVLRADPKIRPIRTRNQKFFCACPTSRRIHFLLHSRISC